MTVSCSSVSPPLASPNPEDAGQACCEELLLSKHLLGDAGTGSVGLLLQVSEARVLPPLALASPAGPRRAKVHSCGSLHISHKLGVLPICKETLRFQDTPDTNQRASRSSPELSLPQGPAQLAHCWPATKGAVGKAELTTPVLRPTGPCAHRGQKGTGTGPRSLLWGRGRLLPSLQLDWAPPGPQLWRPDPSVDWRLWAAGVARAKGSARVKLSFLLVQR